MNSMRDTLLAACLTTVAFQAGLRAEDCDCGEGEKATARVVERVVEYDVPAGEYRDNTIQNRWAAFNDRERWRNYTSYRYYSTQDYGNQYNGNGWRSRSVAQSDYARAGAVAPVYTSSYQPAGRTWTYARPAWSDPNYVYTSSGNRHTEAETVGYDDTDDARVETCACVEAGAEVADVDTAGALCAPVCRPSRTNSVEYTSACPCPPTRVVAGGCGEVVCRPSRTSSVGYTSACPCPSGQVVTGGCGEVVCRPDDTDVNAATGARCHAGAETRTEVGANSDNDW